MGADPSQEKSKGAGTVNECANSWGEADAVEKWLKKVGVAVKPEEAFLLARMVSEPRMQLQQQFCERRLALRKLLRESEERLQAAKSIGDHAVLAEEDIRLAALKAAVEIMEGLP